MAKEVAKKEETAIAIPDFSGYEAQGLENVTAKDLAIPFLMICQSLSPERKKGHVKEIVGIQEGMIFNSVTREILGGIGEGVQFIPTTYRKQYVEWKPRERGGGFVESHNDSAVLHDCERDERGRYVTGDGNHIMETAYFTGLVVRGNEYTPVIVSMQSTSLKVARLWLSTIMSLKVPGAGGVKITPPMWGSMFNLSSTLMTKGDQSWFTWKVERIGWTNEKQLLDAARENMTQMKQLAKIDGGPEDDGPTAF